MDIKFNEVDFDEFLGAFKKEAVNKQKAKGAKNSEGQSFEKWIAEKNNGKVTRPSSDQNKQGTEIAVSTFLKYVHGKDNGAASEETKKWAEKEYDKFFKAWQKENEEKKAERQKAKGGQPSKEETSATEDAGATDEGSQEEEQATEEEATEEEVAEQDRQESVAKAEEEGVESLTKEQKEDVVAEEPSSSEAQAVQEAPAGEVKSPAEGYTKTDGDVIKDFTAKLKEAGIDTDPEVVFKNIQSVVSSADWNSYYDEEFIPSKKEKAKTEEGEQEEPEEQSTEEQPKEGEQEEPVEEEEPPLGNKQFTDRELKTKAIQMMDDIKDGNIKGALNKAKRMAMAGHPETLEKLRESLFAKFEMLTDADKLSKDSVAKYHELDDLLDGLQDEVNERKKTMIAAVVPKVKQQGLNDLFNGEDVQIGDLLDISQVGEGIESFFEVVGDTFEEVVNHQIQKIQNPASEPKKTDSISDLSYKLSLSQIGLGDEDSSQLDGRVIDAIKGQNSKIQDGYLFRDKLTLEANTRKDMGSYGLDKIGITVNGINTNLLSALDAAGVDMDYDRTPFELIKELHSLNLSPEDLVYFSYLILKEGNPALKEVAEKAFDSTNHSDQINFMSMLENHLAISDNEKRKEALKNIKKLDDSAFGDEEDQAWAMIGKEIGEDTLKDMGFTDKASPAEKRLFMKEYYDQSLTAAKRLRSTTNPKALDVMLDVLATEIDGGDSRIMSMASGGSLYKVEVDGELLDANPHYYTEEHFEKKKKDLAELKETINSKLHGLHQKNQEDHDALDKKVKDLTKEAEDLDKSPVGMSDAVQNLAIGTHTKYLGYGASLATDSDIDADVDLNDAEKKGLKEYFKKKAEKQKRLDDIQADIRESIDKFNTTYKDLPEEVNKLAQLHNEVVDTENRTGKLEKALEVSRKKKAEIEDKIKNFNGKGTANRFKIDGQPATFDEAVAAKHLPALALKVQSIQGKMYNGKPLLEAVKAGDKDAIADKKIYLDYHAGVLARKEELDNKAKAKGLSDKEKDELKKASSRMEELVKKNDGEGLTDEELGEVDQLGDRIDELEGKQRLTKEEEEELDLYNKQGVKAENLTPQQKATKALHTKLKHHQYNPLSMTKGVGQGLDDKAKTAEMMGKLVGTYNTMGNGELSMALKDIRSKTDKFKDKKHEDLSKEEQEEKETLEMALDSISIIAQSRGLPLPQGRIPIDPQLMRFLDDDEKLIPPEKKKDALAAIGILARGADVIDNKTGKPITDINKAAKQRAADQLGEVMSLMTNQAFAEFMDDLDRHGKTTLGLRAEMLEDDFCVEKINGVCKRLTREEKKKIRDDMQNQYMSLVELTPDFFAPGVSTKEYLRDSGEYTSKKEKGNLSLDTTPQEFFEKEYKKNKGRGGYGDDDEEEGARPSWLNRLDEQLVKEVKSTRDSLKQNGDKTLANASLWQSDAVTNTINDMDEIFEKQRKGQKLTSEDMKKLEESKEYLDNILHKEVGKAKGMSKEDKAMLKKLKDDLKELMKEPEAKRNYNKIDTLWTQKKRLLEKNGFDTKKLKKPIPKDKSTQSGAYGSTGGDLYENTRFGPEDDDDEFDFTPNFGMRTSSSNSFIPKPLTYYGVNTMKKTAYVDYQGRAQLFKPGMSVYHTINGDPSLSGIVRAVYPAIGMVDVQFPMGDQRLAVEDLMIARDIPLDPLLDKASIPGGVSTQPVSAGAVRVASMYLNRLKGRY